MDGDLISRSKLMDVFRARMVEVCDKEKCASDENCKECKPGCFWRGAIVSAPAVEAAPVVHGRWVKLGHYPPECSVCGGIAPKDCEGEEFYQSDFCQSCGADMRERADEGTVYTWRGNQRDMKRAWIKLQRRCPMRLIKENVKTGELSIICLAEHDGVEMHATHWNCDMESCPGLEEFMEAVIMGIEEC